MKVFLGDIQLDGISHISVSLAEKEFTKPHLVLYLEHESTA